MNKQTTSPIHVSGRPATIVRRQEVRPHESPLPISPHMLGDIEQAIQNPFTREVLAPLAWGLFETSLESTFGLRQGYRRGQRIGVGSHQDLAINILQALYSGDLVALEVDVSVSIK